jgi:hypothetical protein
MGHLIPFEPLPTDFPNHLAALQPELRSIPPARWLLPLLVALCLAPRAAMTLRIPSICPDGVLYIHLAQAIEAGDLRTALNDMSLNIYPVILMLLHRLGLDWETAAALWGVTISSLVVLPLWGWVRRQFDDRVALVACVLYAVHPKMIEWSPEVVRDPTFWFLFMLAIYWLWRAVTEVRHGYFLAAGAAITLAALTRVEGLFLVIPLALWTFWRWLAIGSGRRKLLWGAMLSVAVFPLLLVLFNLVWLYGHSEWTGIRLDPLARVRPWLEAMLSGGASGGGTSLDPPRHVGWMIWKFLPTMARGLGPIFALLMFGGIWGWRRTWSRRDHQALFCMGMVIACGIWIQLWFGKSICPRYALSIVLLGAPFAALGLLGLAARLGRIAGWLQWSRRVQAAVVVVAAGMVFVGSLADAMTSNTKDFEMRRMAADVGRWVQREFSAPPMLVGPVGITPMVSYYSHNGSYQAFCWEAEDAFIVWLVEQNKADVVVLPSTKQLTRDRCASLVERLRQSGLEPVNPEVLPATGRDLLILVRAARLDLVQKPLRRR